MEATPKFVDSYKDLVAKATKAGNVLVSNSAGTIFTIKAEKLADMNSHTAAVKTVLTDIANDGIVATAAKYDAAFNPMTAQVLKHHLENFDGGREEGDIKSITEDGVLNMKKRDMPPKSMIDNELLNTKDKKHDTKTLKNKVTKGIEVNHEETRNEAGDSVLDTETKTMKHDRKHPGLSERTTDGVITNHKEASDKNCCEKCGAKLEGSFDKTGGNKLCKACKTAEAEPTPASSVAGSPAPGVNVASKHATRIERLYKNRLARFVEEHSKKLASVEENVEKKLLGKLNRALKLAAKRQALNLEYSPFKAAACDVLVSKMDIDASSYYPGMDGETATRLIEAMFIGSSDDFIDSLTKRASEFVAMNEEALASIEKDAANIQPIFVATAAKRSSDNDVMEEKRQAAINGNMPIAPSASNEPIPDIGIRSNIRLALDSTKVNKTGKVLQASKQTK